MRAVTITEIKGIIIGDHFLVYFEILVPQRKFVFDIYRRSVKRPDLSFPSFLYFLFAKPYQLFAIVKSAIIELFVDTM